MFSETTCTSWYVDLSVIFLMALSLVPNEHSDHTFCFYVRFSETRTFTKTLRMYTSHTNHMTTTKATWQSHVLPHDSHMRSHDSHMMSHDSPFHHPLLRCHHFPWNSLGVGNTKDEKPPTIYDMAVTSLLLLN